MLRKLQLCAVLSLLAPWALGQSSNFSTMVGTAVLCLDDVEPGFFYNHMSASKRSYRQDQGAYWFKISESLFGAAITEVFVSDGSSSHRFVGVVSSLPPDQLAETVSQNAPAGVAFQKDNPTDKYSTYRSRAGSVIAFQGRFGKMYCRRDRMKKDN